MLDELAKIAEEQKPKSPRWKRVAKVVGASSLGYAAGHGLGMGIDAAAKRMFRDRYPTWSPEFKQRVLFPLLGVASLGAAAAKAYHDEKRDRILRGEDE